MTNRLLLYLGLGLWIFGAVSAAADTLRIGTEPAFPPYIQLDARGEISGFDRQMTDALCERAGLECVWIATTFDNLLPGLVTGEFDIVVSGLGNSPERQAIVDFSRVYLPSSEPSAYVGHLDAPPPDRARIGVQAGTIHESHIAQTGRTFQTYPSANDALRAVVAGQVDLVFGSSSFFTDVLGRDFPSLRILQFEAVAVEGAAIAVAKGRPELLDLLNAEINAMLDDGTIYALARYWFTPRSDT